MTQEIKDSTTPLYNIAMYKSDYDAIKNKNIKTLFDLYNDRLLINFWTRPQPVQQFAKLPARDLRKAICCRLAATNVPIDPKLM